jgi:hypothetical protein
MSLGPDNPRTADSLHTLGLLMVRRGHPADGLQLLERGLTVYEKAYGPDHTRTVNARRAVAMAKDEVKKAHTPNWRR